MSEDECEFLTVRDLIRLAMDSGVDLDTPVYVDFKDRGMVFLTKGGQPTCKLVLAGNPDKDAGTLLLRVDAGIGTVYSSMKEPA